jgi:primase-polymerase (primpol)-like protein
MQRSKPEHIRRHTPDCLRERPQWVCWRIEERGGRENKVPVIPGTKRRASSTDPGDWRTFDDAMAAFEANASLQGPGFVFSKEDGFAGVDLDDCRDPETGDIAQWGQAIIDDFNSYTEVSPSGTGVKIFIRAVKPGGKCKTDYATGEVEMYDHARYFTVTGKHLDGTPRTVDERQSQLDALYAQLWGVDENTPASAPREPSTEAADLDDDEIIRLMTTTGKTKEKFAALWAGRWNDYFNTASEADSSLVFKLAYYTKDAAQLDRLFRQSGLYRDKWDELRGAETYGNITIQNALAKVTKQYKPRKRRGGKQGASGGRSGGGGGGGSSQAGTRHPRDGRLILDTERTLPTAQAFVREFFSEQGCPSLKHYANIFFGWKDNHYAEVEDSTMRHKLLPWLTEALRARFDPTSNEWTYTDFPANPRSVSSALDSVKA